MRDTVSGFGLGGQSRLANKAGTKYAGGRGRVKFKLRGNGRLRHAWALLVDADQAHLIRSCVHAGRAVMLTVPFTAGGNGGRGRGKRGQ